LDIAFFYLNKDINLIFQKEFQFRNSFFFIFPKYQINLQKNWILKVIFYSAIIFSVYPMRRSGDF